MKEESLFKNILRYVINRKKFFFSLLIILTIFSLAVFGKKGILQRVELEIENKQLKEKLKSEQEKSILLQQEIEDLKTSDKKIEQVAREKFGMIKEGEEIYKVVKDTVN